MGVIRSRKSKDDNTMKKEQKDKQQSTKHYTENEGSSNTNPNKSGGECRFSGRVGSSCSICGTHRVTLVTKLVIIHE